MRTLVLLPVALLLLLLLLLPGTPATDLEHTPFTILVTNSVTNPLNKTYSSSVPFRGILLGGMKRLQDSNQGFNFSYTENDDYGPFLDCVNGLCGSDSTSTSWALRVVKTDNSVLTPDVGIGCYIPCANETVILDYTTY